MSTRGSQNEMKLSIICKSFPYIQSCDSLRFDEFQILSGRSGIIIWYSNIPLVTRHFSDGSRRHAHSCERKCLIHHGLLDNIIYILHNY